MKVHGGTATGGIADDAFAMPAGMAIRYDRPSPDLADCITGYTVFHSDDPVERVDWFLPSPTMLCIFVEAGPVTARIGNHAFGPLPPATVIGPTSRAMRITTHGGTMVGIGISATGWARMTDASASLSHNRIVAAETVFDPAAVAMLTRQLAALPDDRTVKLVLDALLPALLRPVPAGTKGAHMALIAQLTALATTDCVIDVADIAVRLGVAEARLRRLSRQYFGMPPKQLLRRARFLRSFVRLFQGGDIADARRLDPSYFDMSHYLRDANAFLGTTPRRFLGHNSPFLQASIRARMAVLGAPTQALHPGGCKVPPAG
ncbi:helix-turn-helix domain-containing protein [Sphingomonas montana]|uniref:helix-turn-helix domain-containing protein n=1 Tax=Sphingomonas montana TaxID=1843236 RepID=UPI00096F9AD2|nr:helix-turn-helix domain-containing protein [Sphingomonas montana]